MTHTTTSMPQRRTGQLARWFVLTGGVINPIAFVTAYTIAGALRPGYSPVHQAISDLGVGRYGRLLDIIAVGHGMLLILFAVGFAVITQPVIGPVSRWLATALLILRGLAQITTATFTEAPATVAIHSAATIVALLSTVSTFLIVGLALRRNARWRNWGTFSLVAMVVTVLLVAVMFWLFNPRSPAAPTHLGGLAERAVSVETLAWWVILGWRLFRETAGIPSGTRRGQHPGPDSATLQRL
jgi:hypothetical membrane protein